MFRIGIVMAKIKKMGKAYAVVHSTNGMVLSRHKKRSAAEKRVRELHKKLKR